MVNILFLIICNVVICNEESLKKSSKTLCKEDFKRATKGIKDGFMKTGRGINNVYQNTKKRIKNKKRNKKFEKKDISIIFNEPEQQQINVNPDNKWNYKDFYDTVFKYENNTGDDCKIATDNYKQNLISSYNDDRYDKPFINVKKTVSLTDENKSNIIDIDNHTTDNRLAQKEIYNKLNPHKSLQEIYKREFPNSYKYSEPTRSSISPRKNKVVERWNDKKSTDSANCNNFHDKTNLNLKKRKNDSRNKKEISSVSKLTPGKRASFLADKVIYKDIDYSIEPSYVVPIRDHKFTEIRKTFQKETGCSKPSSSASRSIYFETQGNLTEEGTIKKIDYVQESLSFSTSSTFEQSDVVTDVIVHEKTDKETEEGSFAKLSNTDKEFASVKILQEKFDDNIENLSISGLPSINILSTINEENRDVNFKSDDESSCMLAYSAKSHEETLNLDKDDNISQNSSVFNSPNLNIVSTLTEENSKDGFQKTDNNFSTTNLSEIIDVKAFNGTIYDNNFAITKMPANVINRSYVKFKEEQNFNAYKNNFTSVNQELILSNKFDREITENFTNNICFDKKTDINELVNLCDYKLKIIVFDKNAAIFFVKKSEEICPIKEINDDESSDNNTLKGENKMGNWHKQVIFWVIVGVTVLCFSFSVFILMAYK